MHDLVRPALPRSAAPRLSKLSSKQRLGLMVIIAGLLALAGYYYYQYHRSLQSGTADGSTQLVKQLSTVMELPDETPTVATVTDENKLSDQPFFSKAKNGDKILIFASAHRAILYRPADKKIIDVAPLTINTK